MKMDMVEARRERVNGIRGHGAQSNRRTLTTPGRLASLHHLVPAPIGAARVVNVVVVYEDAATCQWARGTCGQLPMLAGADCVRTTWWKLSELGQPAVLAGAVSKAMQADVILVAARATEGFPLPFSVWVNSWLPHRSRRKGTLVALIAKPNRRRCPGNRAAAYLRAAAQRAGMGFQITERNLVSQPLNVPDDELSEPCLAGAPARNEKLKVLHRDAARRWQMAA
jgi:hypothetical protein